MAVDRVAFLKLALVPLLQNIPPNTPPAWGKMSLQQTTEHLTDAVRIASGKTSGLPLFTSEAHLPKMQAFLQSDAPMRENVRNPLMPETPAPVRNSSMAVAAADLQNEIDAFFDVFAGNMQLQTRNPFFGDLDFNLNVLALYKHAQHHLRQFGVAIP